MRLLYKTVILAFLLVIMFGLPVNAQNLWGIYKADEIVITIFETERDWNIDNLSYYNNKIRNVLNLKSTIFLEPMFLKAPSIKELGEIYGYTPRYDLSKFYTLIIPSDKDILQGFKTPFHFANYLRESSSNWGDLKMKSVEPDLPISAYPLASVLSSSNCPDKNKGPKDRAWHIRNMKVLEGWIYTEKEGCPMKGSDEKIGHPDTGYSDHVDFDKNALKKEKKNNFIERDKLPKDPLPPATILTHPGHGTSTGSVIISRGDVLDPPADNSEGGTTDPGKVTGVACEADLVPYRAIKSVVRFTYGNIEKAIYEAVNDGCSVISLSLGGLGHNALNAAMEYAIGKNVIIIAAAGNVPGIRVVYPARYPYCIAVAANNIKDKPWSGSTYGEEVTISAPGESVWRAFRSKPNEDIDIVEPSCGTSYSTACVAGVAALWLSHHNRQKLINDFSPDTKLQFVFKRLIKENARCPNGWDTNRYGAGIVNAGKLLKADPKSVKSASAEDYSDFKKQKRQTASNNLRAVEETYIGMR